MSPLVSVFKCKVCVNRFFHSRGYSIQLNKKTHDLIAKTVKRECSPKRSISGAVSLFVINTKIQLCENKDIYFWPVIHILGIVNSLGWLTWCATVYKKQRYVWKAVVCILAVNVLLLFEVGDFPPIWWVFDAHSLWHLGTAPVAVFWYR